MRKRRFFALALVLIVLGGCTAHDPGDGLDGGADAAVVAPECPEVQGGVVLGTLNIAEVSEVSGLAASRQHPGVLWVHNDSGGGARVFAIDTNGILRGSYDLTDAFAWDYEDIAVDDTHIYVADIGDNDRIRAYVTVYRVSEPTVALDQPPVIIQLDGVETLEFEYPDGAHDAETLIVDPESGDLLIVTKEEVGEAVVFRAAAPYSVASRIPLTAVTTLSEGGVAQPGGGRISGGDASPDGGAILLRTNSSVFWYQRPLGSPLWEALLFPACSLPTMEEPNGEAIGFDHDGSGYLTLSEGANQPIYYFGLH